MTSRIFFRLAKQSLERQTVSNVQDGERRVQRGTLTDENGC